MTRILDKVTYHAVYDFSILDALAFARANGFAGVQVAVELPHLGFEMLPEPARREIAGFREANGLLLSLHGPDVAASLYTSTGPLRDGMLAYYEELFDFAAGVGAHLVTIHLGLPPSFPTAPRPGRKLDDVVVAILRVAVLANLERLTRLAAGRFMLCVENFAFEPWLIECLGPVLEDGELFLCWDLPKGRNDAAIQTFYRQHLSRVRQVHLHDVSGGLSHEAIGAGELDFGPWLRLLAAADVAEYCIEVRPREKALESFVRLKQFMEGFP